MADDPLFLIEYLAREGFLDEFLGLVRSGKESKVYLVRKGSEEVREYFVLKVYKPRARRSFRRDRMYREGMYADPGYLSRPDREKVKRGVRVGAERVVRRYADSYWVAREYSVLWTAYSGGVSVPRPVAAVGNSVLMTCVGSDGVLAPQLSKTRLKGLEAENAFDQVLQNIKGLYDLGLVHGDLSAFNMLYQDGKVYLIDFPQAVDLRSNPNSMNLLMRDIRNMCRHFRKTGLHSDPTRLFELVTGVPFLAGRTYEEHMISIDR